MQHPKNDVQDAFRTAMAAVCTPVSVVTALDGDRPHGTTVSAFGSLSMTPPMLSVSLATTSQLLPKIRRSGMFGLNVLAADQSELALLFAKSGDDGFDRCLWSAERGAARLPGAAAWVACTVATVVDGGDHVVVLGDVVAADASPEGPLIYHNRVFGTHRPLTSGG